MPARLRYTLLYGAGLQVFGPNHSFTKSVETLLKDGKPSDAGEADPVDGLSSAERSEIVSRYEQLMSRLPVDRIAA
jgi:hypothetical protein